MTLELSTEFTLKWSGVNVSNHIIVNLRFIWHFWVENINSLSLALSHQYNVFLFMHFVPLVCMWLHVLFVWFITPLVCIHLRRMLCIDLYNAPVFINSVKQIKLWGRTILSEILCLAQKHLYLKHCHNLAQVLIPLLSGRGLGTCKLKKKKE